MLTLRDTRGQASTTLGFVAVAFVVATAAFCVSVWRGECDLQSYGIAFATILAPWIGREWKEKTK